MPIYEFHCTDCDSDFEVLVPSIDTKVRCEQCGSRKVTKLFSTFAAHGADAGMPCRDGKCPGAAAVSGACDGTKSCPFS